MTGMPAGRRPRRLISALYIAATLLLATVAVLPGSVADEALVALIVLALPGSILGGAVWGNLALMVSEGYMAVDWAWQPVFVLSWGLLAWGQLRLFRAIARNWRSYPATAAPKA